MNTDRRRRVEQLTRVIIDDAAGTPPTACFFAVDRFQAETYGAAGDVVDLEHDVAAVDQLRHDHHLDGIDTAVMIARAREPGRPVSPDAVAAMLVEAHWHHDRDQHDEAYAWRNQRNRDEIGKHVARRLG